MRGRGTRRVRGPGDKCAWCKHMGVGPNVCTWKSLGKQDQFLSGADVAAACFGHMLASVWDGSNVRRRNKDRLKQCLALSVSEVGNGADAPPQHAWTASLLDACDELHLRKYEMVAIGPRVRHWVPCVARENSRATMNLFF